MARDPRHDVLFEPVTIGPKTLRNRFYQTPHSTGFGERPASQSAFRATRAAGGWAGVNLELTSIDPEADRSPVPTPAKLWDDSDVARVRLLADAVHAEGSLVGAELWHGGYNIDGSPSRLPPGGPGVLPADHFPLTYSYAMSVAQIRRVVGLYAAAAARAEAAGLDLVYAYGSHSYLPAQFLSPFANRRDDEYGGSLRNRARFWLEVIEAVRTATGGAPGVAVRHRHRPARRARARHRRRARVRPDGRRPGRPVGRQRGDDRRALARHAARRASTRRATRRHCPAASARRPRSRSSASAA